MADAWVGTSGFAYDHWRGVLYPADLPRARWLSRYATSFRSVELDTTFYGLPARHTVETWAKQVPDGFVFATKLSRFGTHRKRLRNPGDWLRTFLDALAPLGHKQGPILAQLPPRWHRDVGRLAAFLDAVPRAMRVAVEVRDPDWLHASVYTVLRDQGAALCIHDLIEDHPRIVTADWVYLRCHGPQAGRPYTGAYSPQAKSGLARRIERHLDAGRDVFVYFDNDAAGHAVRDAADLQRYLGGPA